MEISKRQLQENINSTDFNSLTELSRIGTEEQYSAYLDTIFPSSKINQIMYHKTSAEKFDEFKVSRLGGVYFSFFDVPTRAGFIGKMIGKLTKERMVLAKVNVINPFIINRNNYKDIEKKTGGATQSVTELGKKYDLSGYDSILGYPNPTQDKGELDKFTQINFIEGRRKDLIELAVFNPKNIHILGSKQDIEGFRNFVNRNKQTQLEGMEISKKDLQNQKLISQAHKDIIRTTGKGEKYAPDVHEIQNWMNNPKKLKEDAEEVTKGELEEAKKARTKLRKKKKADRCTRIAKSKYDVWPSAYACVPESSSKALTRDGWKTVDELNIGEEILTYNINTDKLEFKPILNLHRYKDTKTNVVRSGNNGFVFEATDNHKWVVKLPETKGKREEKYERINDKALIETKDLLLNKHNKHLVVTAPYDGGEKIKKDKIYKYGDNWVKYILDISDEQRQTWLFSAIVYDGNQQKIERLTENKEEINELDWIYTGPYNKQSFGFKQKDVEHRDAFLLSAFLNNGIVTWKKHKTKDIYSCHYTSNKRFKNTSNFKLVKENNTDVWCPETENGTWVMMQETEGCGIITTTGNSGAVVKCRQGKIWKNLKEEEEESLEEKWSKKYKGSIDCNNPKGFSQKAHCKGRLKESKELFQNKALDKLSKVGGFELLSDIDKLALLGGSNDERLKYLDLGNIFKQNGGTFGKLEIKVKIKDKNLQPIKQEFSQEFAGKEGYLFPGINYSDENQKYVTVRFDEFVTNPNNFGGGNYEERPIMLANLYPIDYDKIKSDFVDYQNKTDFERDEFMKSFGFDDDLFEQLNEKTDFSKEKEQGLHGWFARQGGKGKSKGWVDCNTCRDGKCKSCGRKEGESRAKYPACRPTPSACKTKGKGKSWGKKSKLNEDNQYLLPEEINEVLKGYIEAALWTEEERLNDEYGSEHNKVFKDYDDYEDKEDTELDKLIKLSANINNKGIEKFSKEDIEPDSLIKAYSDIKKFIQLAGDSVYEAIYENGLERLGTDIWFTRNGHGAGFFDHSYDDDDEKKLIQAGKSLGSVDLYINDNLKLSFSNQHLNEQSKQDIERELKLNEIKNTFKRFLK